MNVFFDNCTAPVLASTLNGYIASEGHAAYHIKDVPGLANGRSATDIEWISFLKNHDEKWIFVTGDGRIKKNAGERRALAASGLHGFLLNPSYQKTPLHQVAAVLVWKWPEIYQIVQLVAPPSMHEIPVKRMTKLRQIRF